MRKYWIFDREHTPQGFPLKLLIATLRKVACTSKCQFLVRRSEGYGPTVCQWGEQLDEVAEIAVSPDELERLSVGTEEWFYNLEACCVMPTDTIVFGLHDSSALFLSASMALAEKIIAEFKDVRVE